MAQIEIVGNDSYVLINDHFQNMVLANKTSITFRKFDSSTSTIGGYAEFSMPLNSSAWPVLATTSPFAIAYNSATISAGVATWTFVCGAEAVGATAELVVFYLPSKVTNANGIIQLFNEQGELVFDSNLKYAKVHDQVRFALDSNASVQLLAGRKYAVCSVLTPREYTDLPIDPGGPGGFRMNQITAYSGVYLDGSIARSRRFEYINRTYRTTSPDGVANINNEGSMLIFDMTGLI